MIRKDIRELRYGRCLEKNPFSEVFETKDGYIVKFISRIIIEAYKHLGCSLEKKIYYADDIIGMEELYKPTSAVYAKDGFCGFMMLKNNGINLNDYDDTLTLQQRSDLNVYVNIFKQLENIVKKGHSQKKKIIFPDLATCDNIFVDKNLKISLIDFDGLQIGNQISSSFSSNLGNDEDYYIPKYMNGDFFTEEIDKTSLAILYFLSAFNVDLKKVGKVNPFTGRLVTIEDIFETIGLDDQAFMDKIRAILSETQTGDFIGEDIERIAQKYSMRTAELPDGRFIKKLTRI